MTEKDDRQGLFAIEYVKLIGAALRIWLVLPLGGGD